MAVTALQKQSEDKIIRQAYQRRKDEIYFHKKEIADNVFRAEQAIRRSEQDRRIANSLQTEVEKLRQELAELRAQLGAK
jgi:uncharacterized protein YceH (UPF0502 family)